MKLAVVMFVMVCHALVSWHIVSDRIAAVAVTQTYNTPLLYGVSTMLSIISVLVYVVVGVTSYLYSTDPKLSKEHGNRRDVGPGSGKDDEDDE
jgi:hypothetical protein